MMIFLADSMASQKSKQNLITPPTMQRAIRKRVPSSSVSRSYILSIPDRGIKKLPVVVRCVASWQSQGPHEVLDSTCLVWGGSSVQPAVSSRHS